MEVNEAIIDVEVFYAEYDGSYYEGFMPLLGCPVCNQETMEYIGIKNPPKGRVRHERRKKLLEISDVCNCTKDEGRPLEVGLQEQASNHLKRL
jgi:hypothetical protein